MKISKLIAACLVFSSLVYAQEAETDEFDDDIVFEGEGLTIVRDSQVESQSGVSVALSKEQMDTTARAGLVEDVMSSVVTLPGVSFGGGWSKEPSVRGSYPRELGYVLDGCYVIFPWHWGGGVSIFSPDYVKSAKLSNGIYSARYGRATSGILEIETEMPGEDIHFNVDVNYTSLASYVSAPIGKKAGILAAGKVTYLETLVYPFQAIASNETLDSIKCPPYIRDLYVKGFYKPASKVTLSANAFFGSDGLTIDGSQKEKGITTDANFDYDVQNFILGTDAKWEINDKVSLHGALSYNIVNEDLDMKMRQTGFVNYNPDFLANYSSMIPESARKAGGYMLNQSDSAYEKTTQHLVQGKVETDISLADWSKIALGTEEVVTFSDYSSGMNMWTERTLDGSAYPTFAPIVFSMKADGNKIYNTGAFALWNFGDEDSMLSGEAGLRVDHMYVDGDGVTINSRADVNPRGSICFVPWRNVGKFDKISFTTGVGLFSAVPMLTASVSKNIRLNADEMQPDRALFTVLGTELDLVDDWKISLEGYFKCYLNRLYLVADDTNPANTITNAYTDGKGIVTGFDLMVSKEFGQKWNGYATYSFIYARYKNPTAPLYSNQRTVQDDPLDEWYYPSFHRFHTLNLIVNYKPKPEWTITVKGTVATGTPRTDGTKYCYPVRLEDGTIMQRYTRSCFYSDVLRTDVSCPIDIRVARTGKFKKHPDWNWEWYFGAQDIFQNFYSPEGSKRFDQYTGEEMDNQQVNFSIGMPMLSMGLKISY